MSETMFDEAAKKLTAFGVPIEGRSGEITKEGIKARYEFNGEKLVIEVVERPFFMPVNMIEERLAHYFSSMGITASPDQPQS
ncbi:hypothetical protein ACFQBQ_15965 [Granulicella cerasi]|uniref:DUF2470 domain-containing protein n=1 Tax=Granulicella cerasi TaxID=741063 RepID=A0ABW1ZDF2_9BACT|nr:hypothetical protein [Granulicella cerasi]